MKARWDQELHSISREIKNLRELRAYSNSCPKAVNNAWQRIIELEGQRKILAWLLGLSDEDLYQYSA